MKSAKTYAVIVALSASAALLSRSAHADYEVINDSWSFDVLSGSCDSLTNGSCSFEQNSYEWTAVGRAGWNTADSNGYLWVSNDDTWNDWQVFIGEATLQNADAGYCNISASVYSTDASDQIGEVDLWSSNGSTLTNLSIGNAIYGTDGAWVTQYWTDLPISYAVINGQDILMAFGRHESEGEQEFVAFDNVTVQCYVQVY
jgi:hypothetical protein